MQPQVRVVRPRVVHQAGIGQDHGIDATSGGAVYGLLPELRAGRLGIGVERQQDLAATLVRVADSRLDRGVVEI